MSKADETKKNYKLIISILVATVFVLVTFIGVWYWQYDKESRGTFGDLFGSVNALYSGLAFIGVVYAMLLQKEELKLQREELKETREQLERSADAQVKTELQLAKQNRFNQITAQLNASTALLEFYSREIINARSIDSTGNSYQIANKKYRDKTDGLAVDIEDLLTECKSLK